MEEALELARAKDTKERMAAVERLHQLLEASRKSLSPAEVTSLVDCCLDLLKDSNFRVSQGALQALASAAVLAGEHLKLHLNALVPAVVERLGDAKQPVRDAARRLLLTLMEVSSPTIIVERAGSYAWMHKSWRIREEFARTVTSAIGLFASTELPLQRAILPPILQMLNDPNHTVREAAILCIEEMYMQGGSQFREELQRHHLPSSMVKDINARLERIEPQQQRSSDGLNVNLAVSEVKLLSINPKKSTPRAKTSTRENSLFGGEPDIAEKPIEPIKVYSEKELIREFEKISSILVPDKDWSIRIAAMQRIESLVAGGAADYPCFRGLLKQLVGSLSTQLSDRRSSIVKQACHLLCFLSKELLGDFESCAEVFIPVLFKLVVITVLVIAESADNCIKTMLRNCKVTRVLPRIADSAKNDRNAVLRARCCEYALLILEHWPDAPEIQRSADLYEDLIRCCVADAMSEVRATARMCYRMFARTWPERSRRLFSSFDSVIQRLINEEEGGIHRRHASPSVRERSSQPSFTQTSAPSNLPGYGTSAIVAMDRSSSLSTGGSLSSGLLLSQSKGLSKVSERSLESVLQSSKQKVSAIESMLRSLDISDRQNPAALRSSSLDLGIDPPSSRDPPFPAAVPASNSLTSSTTAKRILERQERGSFEDNHEREARRFMGGHFDRQHMDTPYRDLNFRDSNVSHVPNFQRPLLRKNVGGRMSAGRRRSFDDSQLQLGDMSNYVDGPASLIEALNEGLSPSSDWSVRVAGFNFLQSLFQQGPKGVQEVIQSFEKVMKLFLRHLDDPHHKVAQAALSTLADLIPSCRKPFESYMERVLPHVFSRLIDPKELVRQPCFTTLDIVSKTYSVDSLLPALLRSLDEQRSPKAKLAVIEFAINSFNRYSGNPEVSGNSGILKLWLAKLTPLTRDKNSKLKEASITCIISVYNHYDSSGVLNYILSLSVEEQNSLRRALKQYTPRIEVDLMNYLQSKKEKQRMKSSYDPSDVIGTSSEEGYAGASKTSIFLGRYSGGSIDSDSGRKWSPSRELTMISSGIGQSISTGTQEKLYQNLGIGISSGSDASKPNDTSYTVTSAGQNILSRTIHNKSLDDVGNLDSVSPSYLEKNGLNLTNSGSSEERLENKVSHELDLSDYKLATIKVNPAMESGPSVPQILHMINGSDESPSASKKSGLQQLIEASIANEESVWEKYFNQILTVVLEVLDDGDSSIRELALSLVAEMLKNQKGTMEDSIEIVIEKLLHVSKDAVPKVSSEADQCLTTMLSQYDPFRCLSVIVPLLVTEDEKTLVTCINCLTKLVGQLSQEELMAQLPSFLPFLFEAFGNQSADVRKTVVFCLVDIYIMLGKEFEPFLEGLNSTQLRLVTIYANRISQARTGAPLHSSP
ncbi:PREDICTED: CLIP-associated protein-like isoform X2 [Tarenaya hassleriana]|uniref:CLIP-associated protein-like isoform X2 n=1 Tax=Tarenaya hassleriana TaxID=28532 RepID=UPI00053C2912|nr:PREDICTED: CLIP-associated protein-like isoform X2 [Tarenaya hassleriana]